MTQTAEELQCLVAELHKALKLNTQVLRIIMRSHCEIDMSYNADILLKGTESLLQEIEGSLAEE